MKLKFSNITETILNYARDEALRTGHLGIGADHIMLAMLRHKENEGSRLLSAAGVDLHDMKRHIDEAIFREEALSYTEIGNIRLSKAGSSILGMAAFEALKRGSETILPEHLLLALCLTGGNATAAYMETKKISHSTVAEMIQEEKKTSGKMRIPALKDLSGAIEEQLGLIFNPGNKGPGIYS